MTRLTVGLALVLSLVFFAANAAAKEVVVAKVCGPTQCRETRDHKVLEAVMEGGPSTLPPNPAPWYRVLSKMDEGDTSVWFRSVVVPRASMIRGDDNAGGYMSWVRITPEVVRMYRELAHGIAPFPADELRGLDPSPSRTRTRTAPAAEKDDEASPLPWVGAGIALLAGGGLVLVRRRR